MAILTISNLTKKYHNYIAVNNVSFSINEGEIVGLLGANGAGKTTIIMMLLSTLKPSSGSIVYFGKDFSTHRSEILEKVSYASTYAKIPPRLTIEENLDIYARLYGLSSINRKEQIKKYLTFFGMWNIRDRETGALSAGQLTRVLLAKAFISSPKIVLLDEPTASLDPDIAQEVREFILQQQRDHNTSILLTSHNMDEVTEVCDRLLVLQNGSIIAQDTPEALAASISQSRVHLTVIDRSRAIQFVEDQRLNYQINGSMIEITIHEQEIANLLDALALQGIKYTQISIDKPTLEDYFMHIVKQGDVR
jgi:ABC-2 type transport system ATP-binding protein